ncbi:hypothetical protein FEC36_18490 [Acinetobacter baumannii]|nr:hypothetical protein FEC36_18490 [Acinetobacter baumannii]
MAIWRGRLKTKDAVYDFEDYKNVILGCISHIEVIEFQKSYEWVKKKRIPRCNDDLVPINNFLLSSLVEVRFVNGCRNMFYRNDFESPYSELDFLIKKHNPLIMPTLKNISRGINESKKEGIVTTLFSLKKFWRRSFGKVYRLIIIQLI